MAVRHNVPLTLRKYSMTRRAVGFIAGLNLPVMLHLRIGDYSLKTGVEYLVLPVRRWILGASMKYRLGKYCFT